MSGRTALAAFEARVRAQMAELSDLVVDLRVVVDTWEEDPARLSTIRERRQRFRDLQRKYGPELADVLAYADEAARRLSEMADDDQRVAKLEGRDGRGPTTVGRSRASRWPMPAGAPLPSWPPTSRAASRIWPCPTPGSRSHVEGDGPADQVTFWLGANRGEPAPAAGPVGVRR